MVKDYSSVKVNMLRLKMQMQTKANELIHDHELWAK